MKKMFLILLIVGILVSGTFSVIAEVSEESLCEDIDFTDENIDSFKRRLLNDNKGQCRCGSRTIT